MAAVDGEAQGGSLWNLLCNLDMIISGREKKVKWEANELDRAAAAAWLLEMATDYFAVKDPFNISAGLF